MHNTMWQPQLSALALIDAHRKGDFDEIRNVRENTPPAELDLGMVALAVALVSQIAADNGTTPDFVIDMYRAGMWAASTRD